MLKITAWCLLYLQTSYSSDDGLSYFLNELQQSTSYEFHLEDLPDLTSGPTTEPETFKMSNRTKEFTYDNDNNIDITYDNAIYLFYFIDFIHIMVYNAHN